MTDKGPVQVRGEVLRPPEEREGYTLVFLSPMPSVKDTWANFPGRRGTIRLTMKGTGTGISYGDTLQGILKLSRPKGFRNPGTFNWGEYANINGVDAVAYARPGDLARTDSRAGPFLAGLYAFRQRVMELSRTSIHDPVASSIFRAMVLGDQGGVTGDMRDAFSASGTTHILSVSGSHVALLAGLIFFLVKWSFLLLPQPWALRLSLRLDSGKVAALVAIPASMMYCLLAGSEVATVRSLIMITVFLSGLLIDRKAGLINSLSASALAAVLYDPSAVFDISFQLSYCAVLFMAISADMRLGQEERPISLARRLSGKAWAFIVPSAAVIIGTAPLVARQFNSFSYVALPANLVVVPLAGFAAVPVGLLSCILYALSPGDTLPLAGLNEAILRAFYALVEFFAAAPSANLHPSAPGIPLMALFYASLAGTLLWRARVAQKGAAVIACMALFTAVDSFPIGHPQVLEVTFLDVGQGDSSLVQFPGGQRMLIDGGGSIKGIDPGRATVAPYLWNHGIRRLDYVVLTHPHPDHMDGLVYILDNFEVGQVWEGGASSDTNGYRHFREAAGRKNIPRYVLSGTGEMPIGGAAVQVLHTAKGDAGNSGRELFERENNSSVVLRVKYGGTSFLFTGDIGREVEEALLTNSPPLPLKSTVMKVPHHGSRGSLSEAFFAAVSPKEAVVSVGRANIFHLPSPETLSALERAGAKVYRTDMDGAVTFRADGDGLEYHTYEDLSPRMAGNWRDELQNYRRLLMYGRNSLRP